MLHQIRLPGYAQILQDFVRFQQQLLEFACTPALSDPLTPDKVKQAFGDERGNWLVKKLWGEQSGKATELCNDLVKLTAYSQHHPEKRAPVLTAFVHDIDFYSHLSDSAFQFSYLHTLDKQTQDAVKPLMIDCYNLLEQGFPYSDTGAGKEGRLRRQDVAALFWRENRMTLEVCPACDGQAPPIVNGKVYADIDHFFPKSRYPFLSIHPYNLVPICKVCNQSFKRDHDPIEHHHLETLIDIFHPYGRPAVQYLNVQIRRGSKGEYIVSLCEQPQNNVSTRVKNLNRVLHLNKLWEDDYLPRVVGKITSDLRDIGSYRRDRGEPLDKDLVTEALEIILHNYMKKIGKQERYLLVSSYARYALSHQEEFDRLVQVLMDEV